ncbi:hypothetical protein HYX16_02700 [Candidatus Woesearchaeota archaeon]|nr:hypothetical protein [Candidatus Woesearchaeota archaeon]
MAYLEFSTEKADYIFDLVSRRPRPNRRMEKFEGIDALVVERGVFPLDLINELPLAGIENVTDYCAENKMAVYSADPAFSLAGAARSLPNLPLEFIVGIFPIYYAFKKDEIPILAQKIVSGWTFLIQDPIIAGRNAISARKIEEFIVPKLKKEKDKEKPKIGIVYMTFHMGLKDDLQSQKRRDFTIKNFRDWNFQKYAGFKPFHLDAVTEANFNGKKWEIGYHKTGLFD